ncbi:MAG: ParA family partition ATPase [Rhodothalassiaceae bacterium]
MRIITVASQKGGAGKTSLVIHLAVALAQTGRRVAVLDSDPQGSLSRWTELRKRTRDRAAIVHAQAEGWKLPSVAGGLKRKAEILLIDTPPHAETAARAAIRLADQVLVPVQPSPMDVWAADASLKIAAAERVPALVVLNRVPPRGRLTDETLAALDGVGIAAARIGNRAAFAAALTRGLGVTESEPRSKAAAEITALSEEV